MEVVRMRVRFLFRGFEPLDVLGWSLVEFAQTGLAAQSDLPARVGDLVRRSHLRAELLAGHDARRRRAGLRSLAHSRAERVDRQRRKRRQAGRGEIVPRFFMANRLMSISSVGSDAGCCSLLLTSPDAKTLESFS